jgi:hypothetical protein
MLKIKWAGWLGLCGVGILLAGCAHRAPTFSRTAVPDAKATIFYGRFTMGHDWALHNELALWLQNVATRKNLYVYFDPDHPVYAVPAAAGRYRIAGFVGVNRAHEIEVRQEFRSSQAAMVVAPFTAPARTPVYLGDFAGQATFDGAVVMEWQVNSCSNNFAATTAEFRKEYPNLGLVPATSRWRLLREAPKRLE